MTDKPIIFSAAMVKALIEGRKFQTRRVLKPQPPEGSRYSGVHFACDEPESWFFNSPGSPFKVRAKYIEGDRLWVREAWRTFVSLDDVAPVDLLTPERGAEICYEAGGGASISRPPAREFFSDYSLEERHDRNAFGRLRASMHMPRWASRLTLTVTEVRVQRLQDIGEEDAKAEGVEPQTIPSVAAGFANAFRLTHMPYKSAYGNLWNTLHGPGAWEANPWVAVIEFKTALRNIDCLEKVDERVG